MDDGAAIDSSGWHDTNHQLITCAVVSHLRPAVPNTMKSIIIKTLILLLTPSLPQVVRGFLAELPVPTARIASSANLFLSTSTTNEFQVDRVQVQEGSARDLTSMEQWAAVCGVQRAEGLQLRPTSDDGLDFGVMTTQAIPANTPVLFVPQNMILSSQQAQQELGRLDTAEYLLTRTNEAEHIPHFYLMVKLLMEYQLGTESPFFHWLNSTPRYFSNGAGMTQFCCSQCLPPFVGKLANADRVRYSKFFQGLRQVPFLSEEVKRNRAITKWAYQLVYTRSIQVYGDVKIAPMADMFNHGSSAVEIQINYDEAGNCYAYTTYDIPPGSPLRVSYADPTNPSFLFARYGFLDETSTATFCKIMIDNPSQQLIDLGYDHSRMLFYKDTGAVSQEVWDVLLYQILPPQEQQAFIQAHIAGDEQTKQSFHQHYYQQTADTLRNHIDTFLQQLEVLSERATARMRTKAKKHPRLPIILKHNEFVKNTFWNVRAQL